VNARERLRVAVQKSGRLADPSRDMLARSGLTFRRSRDKLFYTGETMPVDLLLVRDDDIPGLIAEGACDLGVVGRDVLEEQRLAAQAEGRMPAFCERIPLGFGACRLSIAVPQEEPWAGPEQLRGRRIATTYPALLGDWLRREGIEALVVTLSGSVEIAPRLGTADAICDLVSSGATLAAHDLKETTVVLESEAVLIAAVEPPDDARAGLIERLLRRIEGVIRAEESRLLVLRAPRAAVPAICGMLPAGSRPTLTAVDGDGEAVVVQALCRARLSWQELEDLERAGARGVLVLPVERMLA
jgi:ATP phosphoribosyltransferase